MTTIFRRGTGRHHGVFTTGAAFTWFSSYAHRLAGRLQGGGTSTAIKVVSHSAAIGLSVTAVMAAPWLLWCYVIVMAAP